VITLRFGPRRAGLLALVLSGPVLPGPALAIVNPNISVVGQPFARWTDDVEDPSRKRATLDVGETEVVFDAYLNPYARGFFTITLGDEGAEVEEGFFNLLRGLPGELAVKGGKYRLGFGRLNPIHPHAYPFAERFRVLSAYLPGEESFNETGASVSGRVPVAGDVALTAAVDWLQGDSFRIPRESSLAPNDPLEAVGEDGDRPGEIRPGVLGRLSSFVPIGDRSGLEVGVSAARGTNNVAAGARTTILGADLKAKFWSSERSYLALQGELLALDREEAGWDEIAAAYTRSPVKPSGGYVYADYNFNVRYNVGASYERYRQPVSGAPWDQAFGLFAGLALLEETTAFRLSWERFTPGAPAGDPEAAGVNTFVLRVIYSMGPHKAHQF
jgi:hypothetical protein